MSWNLEATKTKVVKRMDSLKLPQSYENAIKYFNCTEKVSFKLY